MLIVIDHNVPPTQFCVTFLLQNGMLLFRGAVRKAILQGKRSAEV